MSPEYVPLWVKSNYSFLEGASHPDELIEEAHRLGIRSLALTDRDGVYGLVRAHVRARELGVHLIAGAQVSVSEHRMVLLAEDRAGYANLCQLLSKGRLRSPKGLSDVTWEEVCEHAPGLIALWNEPLVPVSVISNLRDAFDERLYALIVRHQQVGEQRREGQLRERAAQYHIPTVAGTEVLYHTMGRRPLQDILTCIRHNVSLSTAGRLIRPNGEHGLDTPERFDRLFANDGLSVYRTREIAERCTFTFNQIRYRYPVEAMPEDRTTHEWLRELTMTGAKKRYAGHIPGNVRDQLQNELGLIHELEYEGYFLTMYEIVQFCARSNILCQGRGSAANSAVCYCLGITAVDPVRMGLLFERFLSRERAEPPDIDLDIEHSRREEVIQFLYERYGRRHAAMVANFIRYRARSALRDVGKVLGVPETVTERISRGLSHFRLGEQATKHDAPTSMNEGRVYEHLHRFTREIEDFPRHLSIHPGGFLLGHEAIDTLVPIENATMPDRTVIQWDKHDVEDLELFKVDLLGLGALNVVHRCLDLVELHTGDVWSLATIPAQDEPTFDMIRAGDTVGTFQIESRAQMAMLPRLPPRNYYDLVIEVSIVRPGPISGGMVHPYLKRRCGEEEVTYPHELLKPILEKTLGIPLFQEQVMQLAIVAADYTPGEADQLRRDMAAWRRSGRIDRHRERLIARMVKKGIEQEFAERVFEQIRGFGEYGFPESHAASFALLAYATSWLRKHYPAAYLCAMLNAQPMGFYSPATLVEDGKHHGVPILPIDVLHSDVDCTLEPQGDAFAVRMGLGYAKGFGSDEGERIVAARAAGGPFANLDDLARRADLQRGHLRRLAECGALNGFMQRRDALWTSLGVDGEIESEFAVESAAESFESLGDFAEIEWDYAYADHSARGHPLGPLRDSLAEQGLPDAATIRELPNGKRVRYAGMVICRQRPGTAGGVVFMTLEDETGFVNLVIWEKVFKDNQILAKTQSFLGVTGKLQSKDGVTHLVVESLWVPELDTAPQHTRSRDFH